MTGKSWWLMIYFLLGCKLAIYNFIIFYHLASVWVSFCSTEVFIWFLFPLIVLFFSPTPFCVLLVFCVFPSALKLFSTCSANMADKVNAGELSEAFDSLGARFISGGGGDQNWASKSESIRWKQDFPLSAGEELSSFTVSQLYRARCCFISVQSREAEFLSLVNQTNWATCPLFCLELISALWPVTVHLMSTAWQVLNAFTSTHESIVFHLLHLSLNVTNSLIGSLS